MTTIHQPKRLAAAVALDDEDLLYALLPRALAPVPPVTESVHPFTMRVYTELPLAYRDADEQLGWPLLSWLSLLLDQAGEIADLYERINARTLDEGGAPGDVSALADPDLADDAWLPWLGQHLGVDTTGMPADLARAAIRKASSGFLVGTRGAIAAAAATVLTGSQFVRVYDHTVAVPGDGGQWDVLIVTRGEETPDPSAVIPAVLAADAKPAGVELRHRMYSASWSAMTTAYPTWADRNGHPWLDLEEAGL